MLEKNPKNKKLSKKLNILEATTIHTVLEYFDSKNNTKTSEDKITRILIIIQKLITAFNEVINKRDKNIIAKYFQRMINNIDV
jgi:regulator of sigma D